MNLLSLSFPLLFLLKKATSLEVVAPKTYFCGNEICNFDEDVSCPELIANHHFSGSCCSLKDTSDGLCQVSVSEGTCFWEPKILCEGCPSGTGSKLLGSNSRLTCPESVYGTVIREQEEAEDKPEEDGEGFHNVVDDEFQEDGNKDNNESKKGINFGSPQVPISIYIGIGLSASVCILVFFLFLRENSNVIKAQSISHQQTQDTFDRSVESETGVTDLEQPSTSSDSSQCSSSNIARVDMVGDVRMQSPSCCMNDVLRKVPSSSTTRRKSTTRFEI